MYTYSYAQVVKGPTVRGSSATLAASGTFPNQGKCVQNNDMHHYRYIKKSHKSRKIHAVTTQSSQFAKHDPNAKGYTCKESSYKVKVSVPKNHLMCTNRFHILQESDIM